MGCSFSFLERRFPTVIHGPLLVIPFYDGPCVFLPCVKISLPFVFGPAFASISYPPNACARCLSFPARTSPSDSSSHMMF